MFKSSYDHFFDSGSNHTHTKAREAVKIFKQLLEVLNSNDLFKHFFVSKGTLDEDQRKAFNIQDENYSRLMDYGVLSCEKGVWSSNVMCNKNLLDIGRNWYIITDWPDISPSGDTYPGKDMVFPIHFESTFLCKTLSGLQKKKALDIFCGSGVLGVYAALCGVREIHFIDLNPRCLVFTQFNMLLNFPELLEKESQPSISYNLFVSNVFSGLDCSEKYDLILANPPFEPVPESLEKFYFTHSYGGPTGQLFLQKFLDSYEDHLEDDGVVIGVDFSPGADQVEKTELSGIFHSKPNRYLPDPIQSCNLREFASRYIALGMTITDYKTWMDHLQAFEFNKLYLFWFACAKNEKALEAVKAAYNSSKYEVMENWVNPLHWNYPCGITAENRLQWTYLDDSFYMREMLSHMQLSNEKLFSEGGVPEYLDFNDLRREKGFQNAIDICNKYLKEFQYGVLGKPVSIEWMTFPEVTDGKVAGNGFSISEASLSSRTRDELISVISDNLSGTDRPKIVIYYEIYDIETKDCTNYFGELANFTISMILTDGVKRIYDNGNGEIEEIQVTTFLEKIKGASGVGFASQFGWAHRPKQTYCFIFTWDKITCEAFTDIISYKDKVFLDGMHKRLSFIISQGLNLVAMVGLAKQANLAEKLSRFQKVEKNIRSLLRQLSDITQLAMQIESHITTKEMVDEFNALSEAITKVHVGESGPLFSAFHDGSWFVKSRQELRVSTLSTVMGSIDAPNIKYASDVIEYIRKTLSVNDCEAQVNAFNILKAFFEVGSVFGRCSTGVMAYYILKLVDNKNNISISHNGNLITVSTIVELFGNHALFSPVPGAESRMRIKRGISGHQFAYELGDLIAYLSNENGAVRLKSINFDCSKASSIIKLICDNCFQQDDIDKILNYIDSNEGHHGLSGRMIRLLSLIDNSVLEFTNSQGGTESHGITVVTYPGNAQTDFVIKVK